MTDEAKGIGHAIGYMARRIEALELERSSFAYREQALRDHVDGLTQEFDELKAHDGPVIGCGHCENHQRLHRAVCRFLEESCTTISGPRIDEMADAAGWKL